MLRSDTKYMVQLVHAIDGARCEPFICTLYNLKIELEKSPKEKRNDFYVLPLADIDAEASGDIDTLMKMLRFPLMRISTFLDQPFMTAITIEDKKDA